jgi:hypothetical protein
MVPMLFWLKVRNDSHSFSICVPLLLVYILLLPLMALGAIAYAMMLLLPQQARQAREWMALLVSLPSLLTASKGTEVRVQSDDADVTLLIK